MNTTAIAATGYQTLTLDQMHESSTTPRRTFEPHKLAELAESLRAHGLIQSATVRPHNEGFEIVAGARRFRAAQIAELPEPPVRILDLTDEQARPDVQLSRRRFQTHDDGQMEAKEDVRRSTVYDSRRDRYSRSAPHPLDMGRKLEDRFCLSHRRCHAVLSRNSLCVVQFLRLATQHRMRLSLKSRNNACLLSICFRDLTADSLH
jgi:hypothetical protein